MTQPTTTRLAAPPEILDDDPLLTSVMSRDVVAIDAEARLPTALHVMATTGVRHLPVVDRGRCLGVLVETDLIRSLTQGSSFGAGAHRGRLAALPPHVAAAADRTSVRRRSLHLRRRVRRGAGHRPRSHPGHRHGHGPRPPARPSSRAGNAMTGRIVLAVAPGTAERAVDTAFALAAERGSALLAVRRGTTRTCRSAAGSSPTAPRAGTPPTRRPGASSIARWSAPGPPTPRCT